MKKVLLGLVAGLFAAAASPASAIVLLPGSCASAYTTHGCLFIGNMLPVAHTALQNGYHDAQVQYNLYAALNPKAGPPINLQFLTSANDPGFAAFGAITGGKTAQGSWSLDGYLVDFIAVEASNATVLYWVDDLSSGNWDTTDIPGPVGGGLGSPKNETNILFFGRSAVDAEGGVALLPEPSSWIMLLAGFFGLGGLLRSHRSRAIGSVA